VLNTHPSEVRASPAIEELLIWAFGIALAIILAVLGLARELAFALWIAGAAIYLWLRLSHIRAGIPTDWQRWNPAPRQPRRPGENSEN
jgi:hypothetical protein